MPEMHAQRVMNALKQELEYLNHKHFDLTYLYTENDRKRACELKDAINFYNNIYLNPLDHFEQILRDNAVRFADVLKIGVGIKSVEVSQDLLFELAYQDKIAKFWFLLKKKLPSDAALVSVDGRFTMLKISNGNYTNEVILLFASSKFKKNEQGEVFPSFQITFDKGELS